VDDEPIHPNDPLSLKRRNLNDPMEQLVLKTVRAQVDLAMETLAELLSHADELLERLGPEQLACLALDYLWMSIPGLMPKFRPRTDLVRLAVSLKAA
jgi:hypothetical protein